MSFGKLYKLFRSKIVDTILDAIGLNHPPNPNHEDNSSKSSDKPHKLFGSNIVDTILDAMGHHPPNPNHEDNDLDTRTWPLVGSFDIRTAPELLDIAIAAWTAKIRKHIKLDPKKVFANERHFLPEFAALDVLTFREFVASCGNGRALMDRYDFTSLKREIALLENERDGIASQFITELNHVDELEDRHDKADTLRWDNYRNRVDAMQRRNATGYINKPVPTTFSSRRDVIEDRYDRALKKINLKIAYALEDLKIPNTKRREFLFAQLLRIHHYTPSRKDYLRYIESACPPLVMALHHDFFRALPAMIPIKDARAHTYITGRSGSGKTELLKVKIQFYLRSPGKRSVVVIDPKGDFSGQIAIWPELATSDRLIYLNTALSADALPCINPFDLPIENEDQVEQISAAILSVFEELLLRAKTELTPNMHSALKFCINVLVRIKKDNPKRLISPLDLIKFFDDKTNGDFVYAGTKSPNHIEADFFCNKFTSDHYSKTREALSAKFQALLSSQKLQYLITRKSTVNLEEAVNSGKVIIFALVKGKDGDEVVNIFGTFIVALLQVIAQRRYITPERHRMETFVFIDECQNFLTDSVSTLLSESGRSFKMHLVLAQQFIGQGYGGDTMRTNLKNNILQNTAVKIIGWGDAAQFDHMAACVLAPVEELATLKQGVFYVKSHHPRPVRFVVPQSYLNDRHRVSDTEIAALKERQISKYYQPIHTTADPEPPTDNAPDSVTPDDANRNAKLRHPDSAFNTNIPRRNRPSRPN